jgi:hypothetical protein
VTFFQIKVLLFVFGISEVLSESLNLWKKTLHRVVYKFRIFFLKVVSSFRLFPCYVVAVLS